MKKNMSSPRLGIIRDSMLTNPRIMKPPLGKSTSRGLSVPDPDFTYGTSSSSRDGGVAEVLSGWMVQPSHGDSDSHKPFAPNFVLLNRRAVKSGVVTSRELSQYRAQRGGANSQNHAPKPMESLALRRPVVPDITFGVPNRPSTPMLDVMSHQYGNRWFNQQLARSQISTNEQKLQRVISGCVRDNRTSLLRRSRPLPVTQTPFKLPRFSQVAPALNTFRDQEARLQALRAHQADSVPRRGSQGPKNLDLLEEEADQTTSEKVNNNTHKNE